MWSRVLTDDCGHQRPAHLRQVQSSLDNSTLAWKSFHTLVHLGFMEVHAYLDNFRTLLDTPNRCRAHNLAASYQIKQGHQAYKRWRPQDDQVTFLLL